MALLMLLPKFNTLPIVRTRDQTIIEKATLVADVGGVYDDSKLRYDHHMADFATKVRTKSSIIRNKRPGSKLSLERSFLLAKMAFSLTYSSLVSWQRIIDIYRLNTYLSQPASQGSHREAKA